MEPIRYSKILVATDGSVYSYQAGRHAAYLARATGAMLYILNVVDAAMEFTTGINYAEAMRELELAGYMATEKIRELCRIDGIRCEEVIIRGPPAETIVDMAKKIGADCIVMGSTGISTVERILIGSVSEKVLRHAPCPVLLVRD